MQCSAGWLLPIDQDSQDLPAFVPFGEEDQERFEGEDSRIGDSCARKEVEVGSCQDHGASDRHQEEDPIEIEEGAAAAIPREGLAGWH